MFTGTPALDTSSPLDLATEVVAHYLKLQRPSPATPVGEHNTILDNGRSRTSKTEDPHKKFTLSARKIRAMPTLTSTRPLFVQCTWTS